MIKTLLNADEEPPPGTKVVVEETVLNPPPTQISTVEENSAETPPAQVSAIEKNAAENTVAATESFKIPEDTKFFNRAPENAEESAPESIEETAPLDEESESLTELMSKIENLEPEEFDRLEDAIKNAAISESAKPLAAPVGETPTITENAAPSIETEKPVLDASDTENAKIPLNADWLGNSAMIEEATETKSADAPLSTIFQSDYTPPTTAETIRNSGLAWSAGIIFFGAVIFMMIFGWFADLLFGSSPWGLVGGIILGGIIGFIQFFRISSQIFKK